MALALVWPFARHYDVLTSGGPTAGEVAAQAWSWSPFGLPCAHSGIDLFRVPARFAALLTLAPDARSRSSHSRCCSRDFAGTQLWFQEPDYEYFSTAHWHPIVNGYSRTEPPEFVDRMHRLTALPDAAAVSALHEGIRYVVVHAGQFWRGERTRWRRGGRAADFACSPGSRTTIYSK